MLIDCPKCGCQQVEASESDPYICQRCAEAENSRVLLNRQQHREDWQLVAKDAGLELWDRQPGETDWEHSIWTAYRDCYPSRKANYRIVAEELKTTYSAVKAVGTRWQFAVRMQAWVKHVDQLTLAQRRQEILDMNATHIRLANKLNDKIEKSIEMIDPLTVKPSEIGSLMRTAAELERKARIESLEQDTQRRDEIATGGNLEGKKNQKQATPDELKEVVDILSKAGVFNGLTVTKTTEVKVSEQAIDVEAKEVE